MKYLPHLLLSGVVALSFSSCAAPGGGGGGGTAGSETKLGAHGGSKFALVQRRGGARDADPQGGHTVAIVVQVEQSMVGGEQEIKASASVHKDGPGGPLYNADAVSIHLTQPSDAKTEPRRTGEARITKTIPAQGGKFKTVVAEAVASSNDFPETVVSITIPGDQ
ncbi:MAG: hypothetical protein ABI787_03900 [Spartobacteria bacterium]